MGVLNKKVDDYDDLETNGQSSVAQVISMCEGSAKLFEHMAEEVQDRRFRNKFENLAATRMDIVKELEQIVDEDVDSAQIPHTGSKTYARAVFWYREAFHVEEQVWRSCSFIKELEERESQTLNALKDILQVVANASIKRRLSSLYASFQISHDKLKDLKSICS